MFSTEVPRNAVRKLVPTGTAEPIVSGSLKSTDYVRVCADSENTVAIYISDLSVNVTDSIPLYAKDVVTYEGLSDASLLYCITDTAGQYLRIEVR